MSVEETALSSKKSLGHRDVPAVSRAARILDLVAQSNTFLSVSELARRLDLPKSSVHGLCMTLVNLGLLSHRPANAFGVGPHVMRWANAFLSQTEITQEFTRLWDRLNILPRETITLSVIEGNDVIYIACRNGAAPLGVTFRIGMRLPAPFTATGKAMLSTMSDEQVRQALAESWPEPLTGRSIRNIETLLKELEETRQRGFSIDDGQIRDGMYCFGAPVRDSTGRPVAGVAVSIVAGEVNESAIATAGGAVRTVADQLSKRLGQICVSDNLLDPQLQRGLFAAIDLGQARLVDPQCIACGNRDMPCQPRPITLWKIASAIPVLRQTCATGVRPRPC